MFRRSLVTALGIAAVLSASIAFANPGSRGPRGPLSGVVHSLQDVELTQAQSEDLTSLIASKPTRERGPRGPHAGRPDRGTPPSPEAREARKQVREAHRAMMLEQLASTSMNAQVLHDMIDSGPRGEAPADVHAFVDDLVAFHATLTPEQQSQWASALETRIAERQARGHGRRGRMGAECTDG